MSPPTCPLTGKHIRYLCLLAFLSYFIYFIVTGISMGPKSSGVVYICSDESVELTECQSLDDKTTCSNMIDANGNVATCIQSSCGYKLFHHIDISVAGSSNPYDTNGATSPTTFLSVASIFYGLVPYIFGFIYIVLFLAIGDVVHFTRLAVLGIIVIVNDEILKKIFNQARPEGSCLYFSSFGFPSGHAATSIGLLTYILLEMFVYHPDILCGLTCQRNNTYAYNYLWGFGWRKQITQDGSDASADANENEEALYTASDSVALDIHNENCIEGDTDPSYHQPSSATKSNIVKWRHHLYAIEYIILLLPVPFTRVYLYDHTRNQVLAGSLIGMVTATLWYLCFMRICGAMIMKRLNDGWSNWLGLRFGQGGGLLYGKF